jgi:uncharacterized protein (TIGR03118 family)
MILTTRFFDFSRADRGKAGRQVSGFRCVPAALGTGLLAAVLAGSLAAQGTPPNMYLQHNLVSDLAGVADHQDKNLINPWGNGFTTSPFWVGDNGSGLATVYSGIGVPSSTVVNIPSPGGIATGGHVTGVIQNTFSSTNAAAFLVSGKAASFLFCTGDGIIAGWAPSIDATHAKLLFDNSATGANYTGCTLAGTSAAPFIFAANFSNATVDVYDLGLNLNPGAFAHAFVDAAIPAGYAPFNVHLLNGQLYVEYAQQSPSKKTQAFGAGKGYVAVFDLNGNLISNLISQGALNAPWGVALAAPAFGPFAGNLLIGNLGDGTINAFNLTTGAQVGTLNTPAGTPLVIQGLWEIAFGDGAQSEDPGTLYFTAGPGTLGTATDPLYSHGLLGSIQAVPFFTSTNVLNGGSLLPGPIAPNEWVTIKGAGLAPTTSTATVVNGVVPLAEGGVGVTVGGTAAPVDFVSSTQINFLVPLGVSPGPTQIQVTNNGLPSAAVNATVAFMAPSFFTIGTVAATGNMYIAAEHVSGQIIAPAGFLGASTTTSPAAAGETIVLYGTGFGATVGGNGPPSTVPTLSPLPTIVIDGIAANVQFGGLVGPGLYQFNVTVPLGVTHGQDALVIALLGDSITQANAYISIAP